MNNWLLIGAFALPLLALPAIAQDTPAPGADDQVTPDTGEQTPPAEPGATEEAPPATEQTPPATVDQTAPATPGTADQAAPDEKLMTAQDQSEVRGSWITGTVVKSNVTGEDVGAIEDILIDTETNTITGAVISVGGFLGIGAKSIVVEWSRLQIDYDGYEITTDLTREEAEAAPEYVFRERELPPPPPPQPGMDGAPADLPDPNAPATPTM